MQIFPGLFFKEKPNYYSSLLISIIRSVQESLNYWPVFIIIVKQSNKESVNRGEYKSEKNKKNPVFLFLFRKIVTFVLHFSILNVI